MKTRQIQRQWSTDASAHAQSSPGIRRFLDGVEEAVELDGGVERGQAALAGADRVGEQAVHLTDIERITTGEVGRDVGEALWHFQVAQGMAALGAFQV